MGCEDQLGYSTGEVEEDVIQASLRLSNLTMTPTSPTLMPTDSWGGVLVGDPPTEQINQLGGA